MYQSELPPAAMEASSSSSSCFTPSRSCQVSVQIWQLRRRKPLTFGPVVCIMEPFDGSAEEAAALANASIYGLAAAVYSRDEAQARTIAGQIQARQVGLIATLRPVCLFFCPWVGHKASGLGCHSGAEGVSHFSQPKTLVS